MTTHPRPAALARYADPQADLDEVTMWSVETHLEDCAGCRSRLAVGADLLDRVGPPSTGRSRPVRRRPVAGAGRRPGTAGWSGISRPGW
jgi:hypothetical protein